MAGKHSKLLVSFCNVLPRGFGLGIYDFENDAFQWVNLNEVSPEIIGVDGIAFHNDKYWLLTQVADDGISALTVLNKKFELIKNYPLTTCLDPHSLLPFEDGFLVTDTSADKINKITFSDDETKIQESEYWLDNDQMTDSVHLNGLTKFNGDIYVSALGPKPKEGWKYAENGKIINISNGKVIFDNLKHPHSVTAVDEYFYWVESLNGMIHRYSNQIGHELVLKLDGYLRGITFDEENLFVAASAYRKRSRNTGVEYESPSLDENNFHSWIYKINKKDQSFEKKRLTACGSEIFDLMIINHEVTFSNVQNSLFQRLWKFESDYYKNKNFFKEEVFRKIVREYIDEHNWEKARFYLENILAKKIDAEFEYLFGFVLLFGFKDYKKSLQYFELAFQHGFDEFWVRYQRGLLYNEIHEYKKALIDLERAFLLNPHRKDIKELFEKIKSNV